MMILGLAVIRVHADQTIDFGKMGGFFFLGMETLGSLGILSIIVLEADDLGQDLRHSLSFEIIVHGSGLYRSGSVFQIEIRTLCRLSLIKPFLFYRLA